MPYPVRNQPGSSPSARQGGFALPRRRSADRVSDDDGCGGGDAIKPEPERLLGDGEHDGTCPGIPRAIDPTPHRSARAQRRHDADPLARDTIVDPRPPPPAASSPARRPMPPPSDIQHAARALADTFLAGEFATRPMLRRASKHFLKPWRGLEALANGLVAAFGSSTRPARRDLIAAIKGRCPTPCVVGEWRRRQVHARHRHPAEDAGRQR